MCWGVDADFVFAAERQQADQLPRQERGGPVIHLLDTAEEVSGQKGRRPLPQALSRTKYRICLRHSKRIQVAQTGDGP